MVSINQQISRLWKVQPLAVLPVAKLTAVSARLKINGSHLLLIRFPTGSAEEPVPASVPIRLQSLSHVNFFCCSPLLASWPYQQQPVIGKKQPNSFIIFFFLLDWRLHSAAQWITHHDSCKLMTATSDKVGGSNYLPNSVVLLWDLPDCVFFFLCRSQFIATPPFLFAICTVPHMMSWETLAHVFCPTEVWGEGGVLESSLYWLAE